MKQLAFNKKGATELIVLFILTLNSLQTSVL